MKALRILSIAIVAPIALLTSCEKGPQGPEAGMPGVGTMPSGNPTGEIISTGDSGMAMSQGRPMTAQEYIASRTGGRTQVRQTGVQKTTSPMSGDGKYAHTNVTVHVDPDGTEHIVRREMTGRIVSTDDPCLMKEGIVVHDPSQRLEYHNGNLINKPDHLKEVGDDAFARLSAAREKAGLNKRPGPPAPNKMTRR